MNGSVCRSVQSLAVVPQRSGVGAAHGQVVVVETTLDVDVTVGVVVLVASGIVIVVISASVNVIVLIKFPSIEATWVVVMNDVGVAEVKLRQLHAVEMTSHAK